MSNRARKISWRLKKHSIKLLPSVASATLDGSGIAASKNDQLTSPVVATEVAGRRVVVVFEMSLTLNSTNTELATSVKSF